MWRKLHAHNAKIPSQGGRRPLPPQYLAIPVGGVEDFPHDMILLTNLRSIEPGGERSAGKKRGLLLRDSVWDEMRRGRVVL